MDKSLPDPNGNPLKFRMRPTVHNWMKKRVTGTKVDELVASVLRPSGEINSVDVFLDEDKTYSVAFLPKEIGLHKLNLSQSGKQVPGSPFDFQIEQITEEGNRKVTAYGSGLNTAAVGEKAKFEILTLEAGEGKLEVSIHGPSRADLWFLDRQDGSSEVTYIVRKSGRYDIHIKFDGVHIPGSPFKAYGAGVEAKSADVQLSSRGYPDAEKVEAIGEGLVQGKVGEESFFRVDCAEAGSNLLVVGIIGPTSPCEEIAINRVNERCFEVKYIPREFGDFDVIVKWGDENIRGSPFKAAISR